MKIYVNAQRIEYMQIFENTFLRCTQKAQINRAHIRLSGWKKRKIIYQNI